jgi:uncharacterized membrane protein
VLRSLWDHRAEYLAFLISFVVIGNYWAAHRRAARWLIARRHSAALDGASG